MIKIITKNNREFYVKKDTVIMFEPVGVVFINADTDGYETVSYQNIQKITNV